ncbi:hypothetical protein LTR85_003772 [Meristemomyces frigidus]|nr:hypothetical protein LTR85_003772 [Meristemomyces frigidus]
MTRDPETSIRVFLKSTASTIPYAELKASALTDKSAHHHNECIIHSSADEHYGFIVTVPATFDCAGAEDLLVKYSHDASAFVNYTLFRRDPVTGDTLRGALGIRMEKYSYQVHDQHRNYAFLNRTMNPASGHGLLNQGTAQRTSFERRKVEVTIQRGRRIRDLSRHHAIPSGTQTVFIDTDTIEYDARCAPGMAYPTHDGIHWQPAKDVAGRDIKFTFWYSLQSTRLPASDVDQQVPHAAPHRTQRATTRTLTSPEGDKPMLGKDTFVSAPARALRKRIVKPVAVRTTVPAKTKRKTDAAATTNAPLSEADRLKAKQAFYEPADRYTAGGRAPASRTGIEDEEIEILARLEEIRLERRLRELRANRA